MHSPAFHSSPYRHIKTAPFLFFRLPYLTHFCYNSPCWMSWSLLVRFHCKHASHAYCSTFFYFFFQMQCLKRKCQENCFQEQLFCLYINIEWAVKKKKNTASSFISSINGSIITCSLTKAPPIMVLLNLTEAHQKRPLHQHTS